jgi:hypothetical protein
VRILCPVHPGASDFPFVVEQVGANFQVQVFPSFEDRIPLGLRRLKVEARTLCGRPCNGALFQFPFRASRANLGSYVPRITQAKLMTQIVPLANSLHLADQIQ